jgi:hypothetical protein
MPPKLISDITGYRKPIDIIRNIVVVALHGHLIAFGIPPQL